jgi:ABC-2 type transport system ATP-binding protein
MSVVSLGAAAAAPAIAVHDLELRYGRTAALRGVSLQVRPGTVYALLGRNGAGKSSLLRALLGLKKPSRGTMELLGHEPWRQRAQVLPRLGVVPEDDDAPADVALRELARFHQRLYPRWDQAGFEARIAGWGLDARKPVGSFSKGQRKLAQLALALGHEPELLVLDDPTLGLDAVARRQVFDEVVGSLAERGLTVLLTTHDLQGVEGLADRVGVLEAGRLVLEEDLEVLRATWRRLSLVLTPEAEPDALLEALAGLGVVHSQRLGRQLELTLRCWDDQVWRALQHRPEIARALAEPPEPPPALSLEEIFLATSGSAP